MPSPCTATCPAATLLVSPAPYPYLQSTTLTKDGTKSTVGSVEVLSASHLFPSLSLLQDSPGRTAQAGISACLSLCPPSLMLPSPCQLSHRSHRPMYPVCLPSIVCCGCVCISKVIPTSFLRPRAPWPSQRSMAMPTADPKSICLLYFPVCPCGDFVEHLWV